MSSLKKRLEKLEKRVGRNDNCPEIWLYFVDAKDGEPYGIPEGPFILNPKAPQEGHNEPPQ
jgi:hypothetical protein